MSVRGIWSDEANMEAEMIMNQKTSALNITGTNAKSVSKEVFNSLYELTKIGDGGKHISDVDQERYLAIKPDNITRTLLADMFADMVNSTNNDRNVGKHKPRHYTWDIISVPKDYFFEGSPKTDMTIGRFIANKFLFESSGIISIIGIFNNVMDKKGIGPFNKQYSY